MKLRWRILGALGMFAAVCIVVVVSVKAWNDSRFYNGYDPGLPLEPVLEADGMSNGYYRAEVTFQGLPGERVPALLTLPPDTSEPAPCIIFLHGIGQRGSFLEDIAGPFVEAGYAMASFDQYTRGSRKLVDASAVGQARAFRARAAKTVIETRRLADYLVTRPDIDPERIYLMGASYGAITGSTAAAFDPRFKAVVLVYGGGDLRHLLGGPATSRELGWAAPILTGVARWFLAPADPIRHVADISPRPLLMQNGREDSVVAPAAAQALYDIARDPKTLVWYDGDHIGLDESTVLRVLHDALRWIEGVDKAARDQP
jgi:dienelactone hydrolase